VRVKAAAASGTTAAPLVPWTLHDLRRTVATGLQRLGVRLEVTEAVLNHVSGSRAGVAGVYQRHDWAVEKRAALDGWAAHVAGNCRATKSGWQRGEVAPRALKMPVASACCMFMAAGRTVVASGLGLVIWPLAAESEIFISSRENHVSRGCHMNLMDCEVTRTSELEFSELDN
jgi:hypothetical protein